MQSFGRLLQVFGLVLVPMALVYYFGNPGHTGERQLMVGELTILAVGAGTFFLGNYLVKKR